MKLEIHAPESVPAGTAFAVRVILLNDSYHPVEVSRNALMGPTVVTGQGMTPPAVEATFGMADQPLTLQPFTFYGRERQVDPQPAGSVKVTAEYSDGGEPLTASQTITIQ